MRVIIKLSYAFILGSILLLCCACGNERSNESTTAEIDVSTEGNIANEISSTTTAKITTTVQTETTTTDICLFDEGTPHVCSFKGTEFYLPEYYLESEAEYMYSITYKEKDFGMFMFIPVDFSSKTFDFEKAKANMGETLMQTVFKNAENPKFISSKEKVVNGQNNMLYRYSIGNDDDYLCDVTYYYCSTNKTLYILSVALPKELPFTLEQDLVKIAETIKPSVIIQLNSQPSDRIAINSVSVKKNNRGELYLIVHYKWTNTTDRNTYFLTDVTAKCFQNGVACDTGYIYIPTIVIYLHL